MNNRLFIDEILYAEGLQKPYWRGKIHGCALLLMPIGIYYANYNTYLIVCVLSNTLCFMVSTAYHTVSWSIDTEIIMQKLDHICISLWCHAMMYPIMFVVLPKPVGLVFFCINLCICLCNLCLIIMSRPSLIVHSLVPGSLAFFLYWCKMSYLSWIMLGSVVFLQSFGTIIFAIKLPQSCFHELFHILTVGSAVCVYLTNYYILTS